MKSWVAAVLVLFLVVSCAQPPAQVQPVPEEKKVQRAEVTLAQLAVHRGDVWVNFKTATPGMELKEGDVIKTGDGAEATVVFFESSVFRLNANTEIVVKRIAKKPGVVQLKQVIGETWTRLLRVSGVVEYEIETPNTVATVRGTGFGISVTSEGTEVEVAEGEVRVAAMVDNKIVAEELVSAGEEAEITEEAPAKIEVSALEQDQWVEENLKEDEVFIEEVQEEFVDEHAALLQALREQGMNDVEINAWFESLVTGQLTEEQIKQAPEEAISELVEEGVNIESKEEATDETGNSYTYEGEQYEGEIVVIEKEPTEGTTEITKEETATEGNALEGDVSEGEYSGADESASWGDWDQTFSDEMTFGGEYIADPGTDPGADAPVVP